MTPASVMPTAASVIDDTRIGHNDGRVGHR